MAKKTGTRSTRAGNPGSTDARRPRQLRAAPRPSASVPLEAAPRAELAVNDVPATRQVPLNRPTSVVRTNRSSRATSALTSDYGYVSRDLARIGVLAVVAFAVLGGLTFVIH